MSLLQEDALSKICLKYVSVKDRTFDQQDHKDDLTREGNFFHETMHHSNLKQNTKLNF